MAPFQPAGERARWRVIYELLCATPTGEVLQYKRIAEALDLDADADRHAIQMAVRRAAREHEVQDKRSTEAVPNQGYRIVETPEKLRLARGQQKRAGKALVRGHSHVAHVDLNGLNPDVRHAFEVVGRAFAMQMDFNRRFAVSQSRLEEAVAGMTERTERTEQEITDLKARLARLEGDQA
jgi:hypothetical protein